MAVGVAAWMDTFLRSKQTPVLRPADATALAFDHLHRQVGGLPMHPDACQIRPQEARWYDIERQAGNVSHFVPPQATDEDPRPGARLAVLIVAAAFVALLLGGIVLASMLYDASGRVERAVSNAQPGVLWLSPNWAADLFDWIR